MNKVKSVSGWGRWLLPALLAWGCNNGSPIRDSGASGAGDATPFGRGTIPVDAMADRGAASDADARETGVSADAMDDTPADVPITCMPACMDGQICLDTGQCQTVCQQDQTNCPMTGCTDLFIDSKNCGLCGKACPQGQFCSDSKCATMCGQGETKCGQSCVKLDSNYNNCGLCGQTCHDAEACVANMCRCQTPNQVCNNVCTHVINNRSNCGRCGNQCQGDYVCNGSNCGCPGGRQSCPNKPNTCVVNLNDCCASGQLWCGHCQDIVSDRNNCGSCGNQCPGVDVCTNRTCGCPASQPKSCGSGVCLLAGQCCPSEKTCNGACIPSNQCCGGCPAGQVCNAQGVCMCVPNCNAKSCGDSDGCGNTCSGSCPGNQTCGAGNNCGCNGNVAKCGDNCCGAGEICGGAGGTTCVKPCVPSCAGKNCGDPDGCGNPCSGQCPINQMCSANNTCVCASNVRKCGDSCCNPGEVCDAAGGSTCVKPCVPDCSGKACGDDDGCHGQCKGTCPGNQACGDNFTCGCGTRDLCGDTCCGDGQRCTRGVCRDPCPAALTCGDVCCKVGEICQVDGTCGPILSPINAGKPK